MNASSIVMLFAVSLIMLGAAGYLFYLLGVEAGILQESNRSSVALRKNGDDSRAANAAYQAEITKMSGVFQSENNYLLDTIGKLAKENYDLRLGNQPNNLLDMTNNKSSKAN